MTDKDKILELRRYTAMSLKRLAEEAQIGTPQTLYDVKNGKHGISREVAKRIHARWPEISMAWLLAGEGPMLENKMPEAPVHSSDQRVPLLPVQAYAGPLNAFFSSGVKSHECESILSPTAGADMAIPISGDSMTPALQDGTIIFIKRINDEAFIPWGHTLVLDTENGAFVKDVYPSEDPEKVIARSKNSHYPDMVIPRTSIFGIYRVLNAVKNYGVM